MLHQLIKYYYLCAEIRELRKEMFNVVERYFSYNRTLLLAVGLWPYKKSKLASLHLICFFGILITSIIFQLTTFMTSKITADLTLKVFCYICTLITFLIKYNLFRINDKTEYTSGIRLLKQQVICLMMQLQCTYDDLKDNNEIAIVEKYGNIAKRYTTTLTILVVTEVCAHICIQSWLAFRCNILPVNGSQSHHPLVSTKYLINQERYFYLMQLHLNVSLYIGACVTIATGSMIITCLYHACGIFQIASYRIENAMRTYVFQGTISQNKNSVHENIIYAVDIHRKAITFCQYLTSKFEKSILFLILFGVISVSLNIFQIFNIITSSWNIEDLLIHIFITIGFLLYMFLSNFMGQKITDHYNYIFDTAYTAPWYVAPLHIQWLILFLLERSNKLFGLNIGGLFMASLEGFATLASASGSYFIVLYSMQQQ